jgi:hypothetical protein
LQNIEMKPREGNRFLLCDQGDETINHQLCLTCVLATILVSPTASGFSALNMLILT